MSYSNILLVHTLFPRHQVETDACLCVNLNSENGIGHGIYAPLKWIEGSFTGNLLLYTGGSETKPLKEMTFKVSFILTGE
jgi:hypothetical protein